MTHAAWVIKMLSFEIWRRLKLRFKTVKLRIWSLESKLWTGYHTGSMNIMQQVIVNESLGMALGRKNGNSKSRRKFIWTGPFERSRRHYRTISKNWIPPTQCCVGKSIVKFKPQKDVGRASLRLSHSLIKYFHPKSQFQSFTSPLIKIRNFDKSLN